MLDASLQPQPPATRQEPQRIPAPDMSCSSGDSQAMLTRASGDVADSVPAREMAAGDDSLPLVAPVVSNPPETVGASACGAMHKPAMTALLGGGQPEKGGVPEAIDVMGIGRHKLGADPSRWRDVQPAGGPVEAQVWMMTGTNIGPDSFGRNRDEDYQAESPAPSNQVLICTDAAGIIAAVRPAVGTCASQRLRSAFRLAAPKLCVNCATEGGAC